MDSKLEKHLLDKNLLADDEISLEEFILELASFAKKTIEHDTTDSSAEAFHFDIALKRRILKAPEHWQHLLELVNQNPITWEGETKTLSHANEVLAFTRELIEDVRKAKKDSWALILIKTSYLSSLDKSIIACEKALMQLTSGVADESLPLFQRFLSAQMNYLFALRAIPFIIEDAVDTLSSNSNTSYNKIPEKQAQVLAEILNCANHHFGAPEGLIQALSASLKIMLPDLPIDEVTFKVVGENLIPQIKKMQELHNHASDCYQQLCNIQQRDVYYARQTFLNLFGIKFDTLADLTQKTLIEPAQALSDAFLNGQYALETAINVYRTKNVVDGVATIYRAFATFNTLTPSTEQMLSPLLPPWAKNALTYYGYANENVNHTATQVLKSLGRFYQGLTALSPISLYRFFGIESSLQQLITPYAEQSPLTINIDEADAFLIHYQFLVLMKQAHIPEDVWRNCYPNYIWDIQKNGTSVDLSYEDFQVFKAKYSACIEDIVSTKTNMPSLLNALCDDSTPHKNVTCLLLVHRLKEIELLCSFYLDLKKPEDIISLCQELQETSKLLNKLNENQKQCFKTNYFNPVVSAILLDIETQGLKCILEKYIDTPNAINDLADYEKLPHAYSYLCAKSHLTPELLCGIHSCLAGCKDDVTILSNPLYELLVELTESIPPSAHDDEKLTSYRTPRQIIQSKIHESLNLVSETFKNHFLPNLDKQIAACNSLKSINPDNLALQELCENKILYCRAIKALINKICNDIRDDPKTVEKNIFDLASGQTLAQTLNQSYGALFSQFITFVWYVIPSDINNPQDTIINNFITFYLSGTNIEAIYRAKDQFGKSYIAPNNHELISVFGNVLGDPLEQAAILPEAASLLDNICNRMLPNEVNTFKTLTDFFVIYNEADLIEYCPYPILVKTALSVLQSDEFQRKITPLYTLAKKKIGEAAKPYAEQVRAKVYRLLGIEIALTMEELAFSFSDKSTNSKDGIEAFAHFYLKYKTLSLYTTNNERKRNIVKLLFKTYLDPKQEVEKNNCIDKMFNAFTALDSIIPEEGIAPDTVFAFIVQRIDFSDEAQANSVYLIILNQLIMKSLALSPQLTDEEQHLKFQQYTFALSLFLTQLAVHPKADLSQLKPGIDELEAKIRASLKDKASAEASRLEREIANRQTRIRDHQTKPFLGYTKFYAALTHYERNIPKTTLNIALFMIDAALTLLSWATLTATLLSGSGALQALLLVFGLTSAIGASASIYGVGILAAVIAVRFSIKLGKELWQHKKEFNVIWHNKNHGLIKKCLLTMGVFAKSLIFAGLKTLFTDFIVNKISGIIGLNLFKTIRDGFKRHPTQSEVEAEIHQITSLKAVLDGIKNIDTINLDALDELQLRLTNAIKQNSQITDLKKLKAIQALIEQFKITKRSLTHTSPTHQNAEQKTTTDTAQEQQRDFDFNDILKQYYALTHPQPTSSFIQEAVAVVKQTITKITDAAVYYVSELCRPLLSPIFTIIQNIPFYISSVKLAASSLKEGGLPTEVTNIPQIFIRQSMIQSNLAITPVAADRLTRTASSQPDVEEIPTSTVTSDSFFKSKPAISSKNAEQVPTYGS